MARIEMKCPQCGDLKPDQILIYQTGGRGFRNLQETLDEGGFRCEEHQVNLEVEILDIEKRKNMEELMEEKFDTFREQVIEILIEKGL